MINMLRKITHSISYTFTILFRKPIKSLAVILSITAFTVLICLMEFTIQKQEDLLSDMYEQFKINLVIMDKSASYSEDLSMNKKYASLFMDKENVLFENLSNLKIRSKGEEEITVTDEYGDYITSLNVIGLTYLPDTSEFDVTTEMGIDYDNSMLMSGRNVCIVPNRISSIGSYVYIKSEKVEELVEYLVIGTYEQEDIIFFCPYLNYSELLASSSNNIYSIESDISNTKAINDIEIFLLKYFIEPSIAGVTPVGTNELGLQYAFSFVIPKGNLEEAIDPIKADIKKLQILEPFVFVFSIAIGFIISMLSIKNRKAEFAVMRSIGASGKYVFYISFIEQAVLCIIGASIGALISWLSYSQLSDQQLNKIMIFVACYLLGTIIEAISIASLKVMRIMKASE
ncbi:MAG: FtsX-like permease family protein [Firmicutes bacterium ADurb.Bin146]|jgi:cell division protein FtsX|nr:MAG: FtsX-like permease family protein [Firmicutes bacterium ADurb.Bin146]